MVSFLLGFELLPRYEPCRILTHGLRNFQVKRVYATARLSVVFQQIFTGFVDCLVILCDAETSTHYASL